jgi:hypothetical protein
MAACAMSLGSGPLPVPAKKEVSALTRLTKAGSPGRMSACRWAPVEERAAGDNGASDGNEDATAYVSYEVDNPRDLWRFLYRQSVSEIEVYAKKSQRPRDRIA